MNYIYEVDPFPVVRVLLLWESSVLKLVMLFASVEWFLFFFSVCFVWIGFGLFFCYFIIFGVFWYVNGSMPLKYSVIFEKFYEVATKTSRRRN